MNQTPEVALRESIHSFVSDLDRLLRECAMEAAREALGVRGLRSTPTSAVSPAPAEVGRAAGLPQAAEQQREPTSAPKRLNRVAQDAAAIATPLNDLLRASGGLRLDEIASRTRMPREKLAPLVGHLAKRGLVRTEWEGRQLVFYAL